MNFFRRLFAPVKEQKFSVHRGTMPTRHTNKPPHAMVSEAIAQFRKLHPNAIVDAMTSEIINNKEAYVWIYYRE